ncbi:MAG TPA: MlaD family protein [Ignavibacteriaceae bacterium]|jgi:phospholipid/cholesterol/gamma-HCH transport system substrate-binding protein|nr:MlaD family protein [Ignavibacteriaceae bacterium]
MKDQSKTEVKVGIMVVAGVLVFLWVLGWAKNFSFTANDIYLQVRFPTVAGLEIGDPVTINGVRKGNVEDFNIESDDVIVKVKLDSDVNLKEDASFEVSMLDLMGGKKINISPGESSQPIDFNKVQQGEFQADIPMVMSMLGKMQGDLNGTIKDVRVTLNSLNNYLTDQKLNENIKVTAANLKDLTIKMNTLIDNNQEDLKKIISNTAELTSEAKELIRNNRESIQSSITDLKSILGKSDSLLTKLNTLADETTGRKNNLGKLLYDEDLYNNLNGTLKDVKELTKIILEQLKGDGLNVDANVDLF